MHPSPEHTVVFSEDVKVERRLFDMLEWRGRSAGLEADEGVDPNCFYSSLDCVCQFLLGPLTIIPHELREFWCGVCPPPKKRNPAAVGTSLLSLSCCDPCRRHRVRLKDRRENTLALKIARVFIRRGIAGIVAQWLNN